ncbi:MFS transporter [Acinetobacter oleivorans]|uniref:MFS transporter n=1 Tax=Acinetobacter oleivorans TaxID=1148157 RepID=UPI003A88E7CD
MLLFGLKDSVSKQSHNTPSLFSILLIGIAQIVVWGGSFFLLAVLGRPIMEEMGWGREVVYGALSFSILVSAVLLPYIGKLITKYQGKEILAISGVTTALGLIVLAFSSNLIIFYIAWFIIGFGMALGLYDTLFAVLGDYFGKSAKSAITMITLISGFCTTIVWPLQAYAISVVGWRGTCIYWAIALIIIVWPIYHYCLPIRQVENKKQDKIKSTQITLSRKIYLLMSLIFLITSIIMTVMTVQLIDILQEEGASLVAAIAISAFLGPSQVVSRILDLIIKFNHPVKSLLVSVILVFIGLVLLILLPQYALLAVIIYGAGNGLRSIVRGTLPLVLVKKEEYALVMGRLARPSLIAQALTPLVGGYIIDKFSALYALYCIAILAFFNIIFSIILRNEIYKK